MIIWERFVEWFIEAIEDFIWVMTARDCEHCKHYKKSIILYRSTCGLSLNESMECLGGIWRNKFERKRKNDST